MKWLVLAALVACGQHAAPPPSPPPPAPRDQLPPPIDASEAVAVDANRAPGPFVHGAAYCPGADVWPAGKVTCTSDADCPDGRCYANDVPDYSHSCGIAPRQLSECDQDRDCGLRRYCDHPYEHHGCGEVVTGRCMTACTKTSCKAGEICRPNGRCELMQCTDGAPCPVGWTCTPKGYIHDEHGCAKPPCTATSCGPDMECAGEYCNAKTCTKAADCDCGACFNGRCAPRPGVCGPTQVSMPPKSAHGV